MKACLALLIFCVGCASSQKEMPKLSSKMARPILVEPVHHLEYGSSKTFYGVSKAPQMVNLSFQVPGRIVEKAFSPGQKVTIGQLLARLDTTDYELVVQKAEAAVAQAQAEFERLDEDYQRERALYEHDNTSKMSLDRVKAGFEGTKSQLEIAKRSLMLARQNLDYCYLRAPFSGVVLTSLSEQFQTVAAGQPVLRFGSQVGIDVAVGLPSRYLVSLHTGEKVEITFDDISQERFEATVIELANQPNEVSTYPVTLHIAKEDNRLLPGMSCTVEIILKATEEGSDIAVPAAAVLFEEGFGNFVWVAHAGPPAKLEKRKVETGDLLSVGIEIKKGLKEGEKIVIRGMHKVDENSPIIITDSL